MKMFWAVSPFLLLVVTACSNQSASESLIKHVKTIDSWVATAQMVSESWIQGAVPQTYAKQTLEKTQQEVAKETEALFKEAPQLQAQPPQPLQQLKQTLQQLTIAVDQPDKAAIAAPLQQLIAEKKQLQTLMQAQGGQP